MGTEVGEDIGVADGDTVSTSVGLEVDTMSVGPWTVTRSECR